MVYFPDLTIDEVKECLPELDNIEYIDKGGQRIVFQASYRDKQLVIKFFYLGEINVEEIEINIDSNLKRIKREINLLNSTKSVYLPSTSIIEPGEYKKNKSLFLYYSEEFINGYNLKSKVINDKTIFYIAEDIIKAIKELWETYEVVHRDIKPAIPKHALSK